MKGREDLARTMRIDIAPDSQVDAVGHEESRPWTLYGSKDPAFTRWDEGGRSSDYEKLLQSVYDGVLITDRKGRIVDFNDRALDFFRCDSGRLSGAFVIELISGADAGLLEDIVTNLNEHRYTLIEARCVRFDRSLFPAEIAVNRVYLRKAGDLCFFVRDISVRKQAQEALEDAVARLEAHDKARSQFVSNVSHELRTPLTSMIYAVSNMLRGVVGEIPDRVRGYLEMLDGDCNRLLGTVNDILDIRKVEDQTLDLECTTVPIGLLVEQSVASLNVQARQKAIELKVDTGPGNFFVEGDAQKLERVILNVVGNAIKFTPDGGVIDLKVGADPARDDQVLVSIRDTGIGIPADALARVTLRYFTVGEQPSGAGLGLAISKEIIDLHGGNLEIESPPRGFSSGTRVSINLPIVPPPLVLMVDDDAPVCELFCKQVELQGYRCKVVTDGSQAFDGIWRDEPGAVIISISLRGFDAIELIMKVKGEAKLKRVGIIVVAGGAIGRAKAEILRTLGIPVVRKPLEEKRILDCLLEIFLGRTGIPGILPRLPTVSARSDIAGVTGGNVHG